MPISATFNGEVVTIVDIDVNGQAIYVSYIDASGNLKVDIKWLQPGSNPVTIALSATA